MDETAIITAVRAGDVDQYTELVDRYQAGLIIHCDRMLRDRAEAEDIAQKAFIKAYEKLPVFDPSRSRFSTWLYKIATNMAIDSLRASNRSVPTMVEDIESLTPVYMTVEKNELMGEMRAAILALVPPEHRHAIEAYYWHGKSCQIIAEEMNVPVSTVKSWLRRAKKQLREALS